MSRPVPPLELVTVHAKLTDFAVYAQATVRDAEGQLWHGNLGAAFNFDFKPGEGPCEGDEDYAPYAAKEQA